MPRVNGEKGRGPGGFSAGAPPLFRQKMQHSQQYHCFAGNEKTIFPGR